MRALHVFCCYPVLSPLAPKAEVLLSVNDIQVTEDDLYHYLKEFLLPAPMSRVCARKTRSKMRW